MMSRSQIWARLAIGSAVICLGLNAIGAPLVVVSPRHPPTTADLVYIGVPGTIVCTYTHEVARNGSNIEIVIVTGNNRCVLGPPTGPILEHVALGRLPAGTYEIKAFSRWDADPRVFVGETSVTVVSVAPVAVPLAHPAALIFLAVLLAATGMAAIGRA